jgi:hypothetical protein
MIRKVTAHILDDHGPREVVEQELDNRWCYTSLRREVKGKLALCRGRMHSSRVGLEEERDEIQLRLRVGHESRVQREVSPRPAACGCWLRPEQRPRDLCARFRGAEQM